MRTERECPRSWWENYSKIINLIPVFLLGLLVLVTCVSIFTQVVFRYLLNHPISWVDEFAVLIFAWMIFLGTAIAQKNDEHISIDILTRLLPRKIQTGLSIFTKILILLVLNFLFIEGIRLTMKTAGLKYPAMEISRGFLYVTIPVMMPLMGVYLIGLLVTEVKNFVKEDNKGNRN